MLHVLLGGGRSYRYSLDSTLLTDEQRQFYEDNGFLVIRRLVGEAQLKDYYDRFQHICSQDVKVLYTAKDKL